MQLTLYTDYSLRVLMYLGLNGERRCTIAEIAGTFDISRNHLMKLTHQLGLMGYVTTLRGKKGGLTLGLKPDEIRLGDLVRKTESNFHLVECFDPDRNRCPIAGACVLTGVLDDALKAFFAVLDDYTLEDLLAPSAVLQRQLKLPTSS